MNQSPAKTDCFIKFLISEFVNKNYVLFLLFFLAIFWTRHLLRSEKTLTPTALDTTSNFLIRQKVFYLPRSYALLLRNGSMAGHLQMKAYKQ